MSMITLHDAYFCLNCELITDNLYECPVCTNRMMWPIENWLNRVKDDQKQLNKGNESLKGIHLSKAA